MVYVVTWCSLHTTADSSVGDICSAFLAPCWSVTTSRCGRRDRKSQEMIVFCFLVCEAALVPAAYLQRSIPLIGPLTRNLWALQSTWPPRFNPIHLFICTTDVSSPCGTDASGGPSADSPFLVEPVQLASFFEVSTWRCAAVLMHTSACVSCCGVLLLYKCASAIFF